MDIFTPPLIPTMGLLSLGSSFIFSIILNIVKSSMHSEFDKKYPHLHNEIETQDLFQNNVCLSAFFLNTISGKKINKYKSPGQV